MQEVLSNVVILEAKNDISDELKDKLYKECDTVNEKTMRRLKKLFKFFPGLTFIRKHIDFLNLIALWVEDKNSNVIDEVEFNDKEIKVTLNKDFFIVLDAYNELLEKNLDIRGRVADVKHAVMNFLGLENEKDKITPYHLKKRIWYAFSDDVELEEL